MTHNAKIRRGHSCTCITGEAHIDFQVIPSQPSTPCPDTFSWSLFSKCSKTCQRNTTNPMGLSERACMYACMYVCVCVDILYYIVDKTRQLSNTPSPRRIPSSHPTTFCGPRAKGSVMAQLAKLPST